MRLRRDALRCHWLLPISCHFQDCSCHESDSYKQRYSKYPTFTFNFQNLEKYGNKLRPAAIRHPNLGVSPKQGCKRDLGVRDRDETETFDFQSETRPRPRPSHPLPRPRRDRDLQVLGPRRDRDRDVERPRPRRFSRRWHIGLP